MIAATLYLSRRGDHDVARFSKVKSVIYMSGLRSRFGNRDRRGHCTYCEAVMAIAVRFS